MSDLRTLVLHPATRSYLGTIVGYGLILLVMTILFFGIPYLLFQFL